MTSKQDALKKGQQFIRNFRLEEALETLIPLAEDGNADAQYIVADLYSFGSRRIPEAPELNKFWLTESALNGHVGANLSLKIDSTPAKSSAWNQESRGQWFADVQELIQVLAKLCDEDDARIEENLLLGLIQIIGIGCRVDLPSGLDRLYKNTHKGDLRSMAALGQCLINWNIDYPAGVAWLEQAIGMGNYMAACVLGDMYGSGKCLALDIDRARHFYEIGARSGYLKAEKALMECPTSHALRGTV